MSLTHGPTAEWLASQGSGVAPILLPACLQQTSTDCTDWLVVTPGNDAAESV